MGIYLAVGLLAVLASLLVLVSFAAVRLLEDPFCPHCSHRSWSKGVPHWRCRVCGTYLLQADSLVRVYVLWFLLRSRYEFLIRQRLLQYR